MPAIFNSLSKPKSAILNKSFNHRLSAIFGYRGIDKDKAKTEFEKNSGIRFVNVDVGNPAYQIKQAALGAVYSNKPLSSTVNKYFNDYLNETTLTYSDISERMQRLNTLEYACYNNNFMSRTCKLVANEATQKNDQNRLISVESPSLPFVNRCYELFAQWGLTQQRIWSVCYNLEKYGEALWTNKVTHKGVERIQPLDVHILKERLEFSAAHMAKIKEEMMDGQDMNKSRKSKIDKLLDLIVKQSDEYGDLNEDLADMFDSKLLGFELSDGIVVPPWLITHFRFMPDATCFFPYGEPPLLDCISSFKQLYSAKTLQGLARAASFPVQLYTVKGTEGVGVEEAFQQVDDVKERYENIGVTAAHNSIEAYSVNTKVWAPDGLLDLKILESKVDIDFVGDIELLNDEIAISAGVPKAYLDQEFGGFGNSGIALMEQYLPFANHVYEIQSAFIEGLGQLLRMHFAITGEFDYNTPFVISMRFPAEEMSQEKRDARSASIELTNSIMDLLKDVLAIGEDEALPEDVVSDILSKYTFLDPTDIDRWVRQSAIAKAQKAIEGSEDEDEGGGGGDSGDDFDLDIDVGGGEGEGDDAGDSGANADDLGSEDGSFNESYYQQTRKRLNKKLKERKLQRLKEISERYFEAKESVYFQFLKENHLTEWTRPGIGHEMLIPEIHQNSPMYEAFQIMKEKEDDGKQLLNETLTLGSESFETLRDSIGEESMNHVVETLEKGQGE